MKNLTKDKTVNILSKFFHLAFFAYFLFSLSGLFYVCYDYVNPVLAIVLIIVFGLVFLKIRSLHILDNLNEIPKNYWYILYIIVFVVQVLFAWQMEIFPQSDRNDIFMQAVDMVESGKWRTSEYNFYFLRYPNNRFLLIFKCIWFSFVKLFTWTDYLRADILLNLLCIDISFFCLIKLIRRIWNDRRGFIVLLFLMLYPPTYTFVPFVYSDTLILPFIVAILWGYYFFVVKYTAENKNDKKNKLKLAGKLFLIAVNIFIAYEFKATAFIILIAIIMHLFTVFKLKKALTYAVLIISGVVVITCSFNFGIRQSEIFDEAGYKVENFPYTHWIMMGLSDLGYYNLPDREYTSSFLTKEDKTMANIKVIKERLIGYGYKGFLKHTYVKNSYTWGNTTYMMNLYLSQAPIKESILGELIYPDGKLQWLFVLYSSIMNFILMVGMAFSGYYGYKEGKKGFITVLRVAMFGLCMFLLIWETSARYLFHFFPLMLIIAVDGWILYRKQLKNKRNNV